MIHHSYMPTQAFVPLKRLFSSISIVKKRILSWDQVDGHSEPVFITYCSTSQYAQLNPMLRKLRSFIFI